MPDDVHIHAKRDFQSENHTTLNADGGDGGDAKNTELVTNIKWTPATNVVTAGTEL